MRVSGLGGRFGIEGLVSGTGFRGEGWAGADYVQSPESTARSKCAFGFEMRPSCVDGSLHIKREMRPSFVDGSLHTARGHTQRSVPGSSGGSDGAGGCIEAKGARMSKDRGCGKAQGRHAAWSEHRTCLAPPLPVPRFLSPTPIPPLHSNSPTSSPRLPSPKAHSSAASPSQRSIAACGHAASRGAVGAGSRMQTEVNHVQGRERRGGERVQSDGCLDGGKPERNPQPLQVAWSLSNGPTWCRKTHTACSFQ